MSGIVGLLYLDGRPIDVSAIDRMVATLVHRGPDGSGTWSDGSIGLGHAALNVTPESCSEHQPYRDDAQHLTVTADARLDNRPELLAALDIARCEAPTDAELILRSYERWGEGCAERLIGDFAFAVWDGRRRALFCARDALGSKPLYYVRTDHLFAFASEIKALLTLPGVSTKINELRIADFLVEMTQDTVSTFYRGILRLSPAHSLTVGPAASMPRRYWSLDPSREIRLGSDAEYAEGFRDVFFRSVQDRLRSVHPVGSALSGGLDSAAIVCVAREILSRNRGKALRTFSGRFEDLPRCDEGEYIDAVLAKGGVEKHCINADQLSPLSEIERVLWHEDEPFWSPTTFYIYLGIYKAAAQLGVRVMLDGIDGDLAVSHGYARLAELARAGRWLTLAGEVSGLARHQRRPARDLLWLHGLSPLVPGQARRWYRRARGRSQDGWTAPSLIHPDFARRLSVSDRVQELQRDRLSPPRTTRQAHWLGLTSGRNAQVLEVLDKAGAAFSLEPRHPFFDRRVIEYCLALPPEQKLNHGWTRVVVRHALEGILPPEIRWRGGKGDVGPNFTHGMLKWHGAQLSEFMTHGLDAIASYVDVGAVRDVYERCLATGGYDDGTLLWKVVTFARWLQRDTSAATIAGASECRLAGPRAAR